jgi:hypothetical protein
LRAIAQWTKVEGPDISRADHACAHKKVAGPLRAGCQICGT